MNKQELEILIARIEEQDPTLVEIGVKEIEVGFPSAGQTEFDFISSLSPYSLGLSSACHTRAKFSAAFSYSSTRWQTRPNFIRSLTSSTYIGMSSMV